MPVLNWSLVLMSMGMGLPSEESDASFEAAVLAELKEAVHTQLAEEVRDLEASLSACGASHPALLRRLFCSCCCAQ